MPNTDYRAPVRIRLDPVDILSAFARAWVELRDERADLAASRRAILLVSAQAFGEMADDRTTPDPDDQVCYNHNLTGNKRPRRPDGTPGVGPWTTLGTHEVISSATARSVLAAGLAEPEHYPHEVPEGKTCVYFKNLGPERSHPATHFRAFDSLDEGAAFSLGRYLVSGSRYATSAVLSSLLAGDVARFCVELKALGYYTATAAEYARLVAREHARVDLYAERVPWAELPLFSSAHAKRIAAEGAATLFESVRAGQADTLTRFERSREGGGDGSS